jgi:hypothetical protein
MKKILFIVLILFGNYSYAQLLTGLVKDALTNENIPFVNVGIVGKGVGTVTNNDGAFKLNLNNNDSDTLRVSMLGYSPQSFLVADLKKQATPLIIMLAPRNIQLNEVKISGKKYKQSILGNTTKSKSVNAGFTSNKLGNEIGEIIKIKKSPTYLLQFNASLSASIADSVKLRLNIYSVKDGLPDKNLLQQNIFITVKKGQEDITLDLTPYHIVVDDKFFISLEWIQNTPGHGLMFSASLFGSAIISRETSQANWEKVGLAGVGFNVLAEY